MKKLLPIGIIGVLILSGFGAAALTSDREQLQSIDVDNELLENEDLGSTHTVLAEYGTATWCGYCKYAHAGLKKVYKSGDYDFYYVSLVRDKNPSVIDPRLFTELNLYGYPTVYFDGGYRVSVGGSTGSEYTYRASLSACRTRAVYDVDIDLDVTWLGGTSMQIDCSVQNNEANTYTGVVRVYITEIISSQNWRDTDGYLYTFPLLDFVFKKDLTGTFVEIPSGGSWSDSTTWDGSAHGHGSITEDNIMVIAAVFNDDWHQGYSYPPSTNPFDAYYVDDCVGVRVGDNRAPEKPTISGKTSGATGTEYNYTFSADDQDWFDDVYLHINWGDGTTEEWIGPYDPGEEVTIGHSWATKDTYTISCKAKDNHDAEGPEETLEVTMPKNKLSNNLPVLRFLEQHIRLFPILRYLLGFL
jgi:hypothetical protein